MRLCRFNEGRLGLVEQERILDVTSALDTLPEQRYPFPSYDMFIANVETLRPMIETAARTAQSFKPHEIKFLSPVANPGKIVAAPVNYKKHLEEARTQSELHHNNQIAEIQRVGVFLKATSSLIGAGQGITIRLPDRRNDHEIELVAIIGKVASNVKAAQALDYVAGYTIGLDMTVRGPEERSLRKSIDTYSVLGPWIVTSDEFGDPKGVELTLSVNGDIRQRANTADLIMDVRSLIEFASRFYTLHPGDVLFTGTPDGVGPVSSGDKIAATISRIGTLEVDVL
jgi:2,4-didehydro-3-deoxy-L-rhamnonate hydrolase